MWIVKLALSRPYTFIVLAILILIAAPVVILRTPTDIFPNIDIPVVAVAWQYQGLNPEEMEGRLTSAYERFLTTFVDNIEHVESTTYSGTALFKIYLQPGTSLDIANTQVNTASTFAVRMLPPGIQPPLITNFSASSVPIVQLGLSGLSEQLLNDIANNNLRPALVTVPGTVMPAPYGGKQRTMIINLNPGLMEAKGVSPVDILNALGNQNVIEPGGIAKMGQFEYDIRLNAAPLTLEGIGNIPIRQFSNNTLYIRDVASVADGFTPQTNIVRQDGQRGVLITVLKSGKASTLSVVDGVKENLPAALSTLTQKPQVKLLNDQSIFVRSSIKGVVREGVIAAVLTGLMILLFLGNWRSTLIIAISIPLSVLVSIIVLGLLGETINIMTLGGLALAVGILVDDATVEIENTNRYLEEGHNVYNAILEGAAQIAVPALVSTLCICIVFLPMFFLTGVSRFLFVPLAEAVVFAMLASYFLSRTLVPTMALYLLKPVDHHAPLSQSIFARIQRLFERGFESVREGYALLLGRLIDARKLFIPGFLLLCLSTFLLVPFLGQNFFPTVDNGSFILHFRAPTGTRIEETARLCDLIEQAIRNDIPPDQLETILDNIGLPYSTINTLHTADGLIGSGDANIMVALKQDHKPTADFVRTLRTNLPRAFPGTIFYFLPSDIVSQILNFGLPSPIDVQIEGTKIEDSRKIADSMLEQFRHVPGLTDLRIQQPSNYPVFNINVDRTKAAQGGYTEKDVGTSLLNILSGSGQLNPQFFLNYQNGVNYSLVARSPQFDVQSLQDLENIPLTAPGATRPEILADVATITPSSEMQVINHYNIRRVLDIYGNVQDRDLGAVEREINRIVAQQKLPSGTFIHVRGQIETMHSSYTGLFYGLGFAIVLVYLLIVVNFQSWLDPFIIITALPAALSGIVLFLFLTHTTLSVPALMGAIMSVGVATSNSILVVSFAKDRLLHHGDAIAAAMEAGATRFRPVCMTALAMIIGMVPMALGAGEGGEQNAPLGRAVIGGLMFATLATLIFVPTVFALLHNRRRPAAAPPQPNSHQQAAGV